MERSIMKEKMPKQSFKRRFCPFIRNPFDDCYCIKLASQDIEKTIIYCSGNFERCEVFIANSAGI